MARMGFSFLPDLKKELTLCIILSNCQDLSSWTIKNELMLMTLKQENMTFLQLIVIQISLQHKISLLSTMERLTQVRYLEFP